VFEGYFDLVFSPRGKFSVMKNGFAKIWDESGLFRDEMS